MEKVLEEGKLLRLKLLRQNNFLNAHLHQQTARQKMYFRLYFLRS